MLTKLILENFQCHSYLELELDRITVLVGNNGVGKSAVLRALRWLCLNDWSGKKYQMIRCGEKSCKVEIEIDGHRISREKSPDSIYRLDDREFRACGVSVPDPISSLLKLGPDNFQGQHDLPFWMMLSSGQAAQALNEIFCLSTIDQALSNAGNELRQARAKISVYEDRIEDVTHRLQRLQWVDDAQRDLEEIESTQLRLEEINHEEESLLQIQELESRISILAQIQELGQQALEIAQQLLKIEEETRREEEILSLEEELCHLQKDLASKEKKLQKFLAGKCPLCKK